VEQARRRWTGLDVEKYVSNGPKARRLGASMRFPGANASKFAGELLGATT
jgi:hypothetical protein